MLSVEDSMRYLLGITGDLLIGVGLFALGAFLWHLWVAWPLSANKAIGLAAFRAMSPPLIVAGALFMSYGTFWLFFAEGLFRRLLVK
jgi:hypothetical protein